MKERQKAFLICFLIIAPVAFHLRSCLIDSKRKAELYEPMVDTPILEGQTTTPRFEP